MSAISPAPRPAQKIRAGGIRVRPRKPRGKKPQGAVVLSYSEAMALAKKWNAKAPPFKPGEKSLAEIMRDSPLRGLNAERERKGLPSVEFDASLPEGKL